MTLGIGITSMIWVSTLWKPRLGRHKEYEPPYPGLVSPDHMLASSVIPLVLENMGKSSRETHELPNWMGGLKICRWPSRKLFGKNPKPSRQKSTKPSRPQRHAEKLAGSTLNMNHSNHSNKLFDKDFVAHHAPIINAPIQMQDVDVASSWSHIV